MAYEFDGNKYSRVSSHQMAWGERLIAELDLVGNERILDLGCGDGGLSAKLAAVVPQGEVLGIDASVGMLEAAQKHECPNLSFQLLNIDDLIFENEFDIVFSNAALHWVGDHELLLSNVAKSLRAGGVARFNFGAYGNCPEYFQVVRDTMTLPEYSQFFEDFEWPYFMPSIDNYRELVSRYSFSAFEVWGEDADRIFEDADALAGWIDQPSIVPFLVRVDESHKRAFRDEVVRKTMELTRMDDGRYFAPFRRVNLLATK